MRYRLFTKSSLIVFWIAAAVWFGADSLKAQKQSSGKEKYPAEHTDEKLKPQRPDKQVSELTESVAAKLAHAGDGGQKPARRNLIDQHLFGAMERDRITHAPL